MQTSSFARVLIALLLCSPCFMASADHFREVDEGEAQANGTVSQAVSATSVAQAAKPATAPSPDDAFSPSNKSPEDEFAYHTESVRGRVVWMSEGLNRILGITSVPEAKERILAIETIDGELLPIVEDLRGRSFRTDQRLREMQVELLVRRYEATPMIQIVKIHEIKDGKKYVVDYWCDVCAIVMFEMGPCACCQDDNRIRKRLVED